MNLASKLGIAALAAALTAGLTVPASSATSAPVARKAAYKPTLKASSGTIEATKKLVLSGKVKPVTRGKVTLEKRIGDSKKWSTEARLKVSKKGAFTYTDKPKTPGVRYYRVVAPKVGKVKAGKSKTVKVTVLSWRSLTNTPFRQSQSTAVIYGGLSIAGKPYAPAIIGLDGAAQGSADWNLDPTCRTLRVRLGNGDQSDANATGQVVLTDAIKGTTLFSKAFALTQSEVATFDVRGVFRLSYTWTSLVSGSAEPQAGAQPVLAQPELLCAS